MQYLFPTGPQPLFSFLLQQHQPYLVDRLQVFTAGLNFLQALWILITWELRGGWLFKRVFDPINKERFRNYFRFLPFLFIVMLSLASVQLSLHQDDIRFAVQGSLPVTLTTAIQPIFTPVRSTFHHHQFGIRRRLRYQLETVRKSKPPQPPMMPMQLLPTPFHNPYRIDLASLFKQYDDRNSQQYYLDMYEIAITPTQNMMPTQLGLTVPMFLFEDLLNVIDPIRDYENFERLKKLRLQSESQADVVRRAHYATRELIMEPSHAEQPPPRTCQVHLAHPTEGPDDMPIVFDTGCSLSITPFKEDFVDDLGEPDCKEMKGLADSTRIEGMGTVEWTVRDLYGQVGTIRTKAYLIPQATIRLFSPQEYIFENHRTQANLSRSGVHLTTKEGTLSFPWNDHTNLPMMLPDWTPSQPEIPMSLVLEMLDTVSAVDKLLGTINKNLTQDQKELLLWHQRFGHSGFLWNQALMNHVKTEVGEEADPPKVKPRYKGAARCPLPKCSACQLSKQHRKTPDSSTIHVNKDREMAIRRNNLNPGDCVSLDQYTCKTPGRLATTYGKEKEDLQYNGGTIYVDHASSFVFIHNQISLRSGETIQGKHKLERFMDSLGIKVTSYRGDNHPFGSAAFLKDLKLQDQTITYSGVGAHFQNGVAERALQTITYWARAMMMHQLLNWPDQFDPTLWPFALEHAAYLWNNMPKQGSRYTPLELLARTKSGPSPLQQARVWGCPAFVLDPKLQDGHKLPKWKPRSRIGMYLGASPTHAPTVGRILSLSTGKITPQYHVMFDELFTTVAGYGTDEVLDSELWDNMLKLGSLQNNLDPTEVDDAATPFQELFDDFVHEVDDPLDDADTNSTTSSTSDSSSSSDEPSPTVELILDSPSLGTAVPRGVDTDADANDIAPQEPFQPEPEPSSPSPEAPKRGRGRPRGPTNKPIPNGTRTRSGALRTRTGRTVKPTPKTAATVRGLLSTTQRFQVPQAHLRYNPTAPADRRKLRYSKLDAQHMATLNWNQDIDQAKSPSLKRLLLQMIKTYDAVSDTQEDWSPLILGAKSNDPDTMDWHEAMTGPYEKDFWLAAEKEINTLKSMDVWDEVPRQDWMNVLPGTWAFRIKRIPDGTVSKFKARFCARGDRQIKGVDFFETYAPVVNWNTVRLLLILSAQLKLANTQIDFVAAFVNADIDLPPDYDLMSPEEQARQGVFVDMPRGFGKPGTVLKLKKSLYGLSQSPRNFGNYTRDLLVKIGFEQQIDVDPCLYISDKVIIVTYVDDCLIFAYDKKDIDDTVKNIREHIELEVEDSVAGFLGVHIDRDEATGKVTLTQKGLTQKILASLHVENLPAVDTPADSILHKDEDGDPPDCTFSYASVIGALWYLYGHSRPDIGFAVSQAARFSFSPKRSHELALIRIGQYLKGTADMGMVMKPFTTDGIQVDAYVDSDFMGLYGKEDRSDPMCAKSRSGFVILVNGCPIIWSSKLQETIALSTMMAEYYALSSAMREVLPLRSLITVVAESVGLGTAVKTSFKTTIWEDNIGALTLANLDPGQQTPRSKHYDCRVHWFRSHLSRDMIVDRVDTKMQLADLFTKPLPREPFQRLRKMLIGW